MNKKEFEKKLIELVKNNELIYNKSCRSYKNIALKAEKWAAIASILGKSVTDVTTKWKSLRDKFVRERKLKRLKPLGSGSKIKPEWELYNSMIFLQSYIKPRKSVGNFQDLDCDENLLDLDTWDERIEVKLSPPSPSPSPSPSASTSQLSTSTSKSTSKKRKKSDVDTEEEMGKLLIDTMGCLKKYIESKISPSNSSVSQKVEFFLGSLNEDNRRKAEKKILQYLCHCQLMNLNDGDVDDVFMDS